MKLNVKIYSSYWHVKLVSLFKYEGITKMK
jgi:hypothetical protein